MYENFKLDVYVSNNLNSMNLISYNNKKCSI
jgi:hypothetical protein